MNMTELLAAYAHGQRVQKIIHDRDPSIVTRKYPEQHKLVGDMTDLELNELFRYLERMQDFVYNLAQSYEIKIKPADKE